MKRITAIAIALLALVSTTSACTTKDNSMTSEQRIEEVAAAARADIDALATQLGTDPEVRQDTINVCGPEDDWGKSLGYILHVTVEDPDTAVELLRGEISDQLAADGWTVKPRPSGSAHYGERVSFQKGTTTMGAAIFTEKHYAAVSGSGGCFPK